MSQGGLDLSFPLSAEQTGGVMSVIQIQVAPAGWPRRTATSAKTNCAWC
jgi:hypothetical protein